MKTTDKAREEDQQGEEDEDEKQVGRLNSCPQSPPKRGAHLLVTHQRKLERMQISHRREKDSRALICWACCISSPILFLPFALYKRLPS